MDSQVLRAYKVVSKKKLCTTKIFNHIKNNVASNYDYESLENEFTELKNNWIIDERFKIILSKDVLNFLKDDVDITPEISDMSFLKRESCSSFFKQQLLDS